MSDRAVNSAIFGSLVVAASIFLFVASQVLPVIESQAVTCGGGIIDGGYNLADAGATIDGGYPITQLTSEADGYSALVVANNSANLVYLGDSAVQPDDGFPICTTDDSCSRQDFPANARQGALYCTGTAAQEVRLIAGGR